MNGRAELRELLEAKKKRLHELLLEKARMGPTDIPVHCITEIEEIEEEIQKLESQISWYDDGSVTSNDIPKVVCAIIEQLKRLGTGEKVTLYVIEIPLG